MTGFIGVSDMADDGLRPQYRSRKQKTQAGRAATVAELQKDLDAEKRLNVWLQAQITVKQLELTGLLDELALARKRSG